MVLGGDGVNNTQVIAYYQNNLFSLTPLWMNYYGFSQSDYTFKFMTLALNSKANLLVAVFAYNRTDSCSDTYYPSFYCLIFSTINFTNG